MILHHTFLSCMFPCTFVEMFEMEQGTCNYEMINLVMHYNVLTRLLSKYTSRIS